MRSRRRPGSSAAALAGAVLALALLLALPAGARAQVPELGPPEPLASDRRFTVGLGPGATAILNMLPDWSATLTLSLGYAIDERWTVSVAPYWERETDHLDGESVTYDEVSVAVGVSYALDDRWSLGFELDFGLGQNALGPWQYNPEFGVGVGVSYAIPLARDWNLVLGPELAWKISDGEISLGINTGVTFSF